MALEYFDQLITTFVVNLFNPFKSNPLDFLKRIDNEKRFTSWEERQDGSRMYWFVVKGKTGWSAKYLKTVDRDERTVSFWQEIYDESGNLVEIHEKFPIDKGHQKL